MINKDLEENQLLQVQGENLSDKDPPNKPPPEPDPKPKPKPAPSPGPVPPEPPSSA